jgi:hypothetical protein
LQLLGGPVADSDRARATVAGKRQLSLAGAGAAVEPVEHVQARMGQLRRVHQPPEVGLRLGCAAKLEEGVDREGAVADPGEAVVPVALAADLLWQ